MNLTNIFLKILNMSFTGSVIVVMILLVRLLYHRLPKKYLCILWCMVLIRLLCPFTFPELAIGTPVQEPIPSNIMEISEPYIASDIEVLDNTVNRVLQQNFTPEVGASVNPMQIVMTLGTYLWIAGIIGMLIFTGWKLYRFYKMVREGVPDKTLDKRIYRCAVATPVVTGIVTPKIYLPFSLEEPQLSHVLIHEKMHIRRKDHILKLLFYIALIVHWFNPFVWISYRLLERDMEMACDEAVLEKLGDGEKKDYCESLLDLASSKNHFIGNPVAFGESDVKVRIKNVLNYKKPRFWISMIAVVILIITALSCLSGPKSVATDGTREISGISFYNTQEYSTVNSELSAKNFLYFIFTSISGRYETYVEATGGKYNPNNRDEMFLESDYSAAYLNNFKDRATENCLQNMENSGYFTLVDYLSAQAGSQVRFENAVLTATDEMIDDKDVEHYLYTAKLTNEKDGDVKEFTVQGSITVENMLNGWKVTDFMLSDSQALSMYVTGENVYRQGYTAEVTQIEHEPAQNSDWGVTLSVQDVTPKGLTMICSQNDENLDGDLYSSSFYSISKFVDGEWKDVAYILPENEIAWTDGAWEIPKAGTVELEVNWETLYGELQEGQYRIGKRIMYSAPRNLESVWYDVEFTINK